MYRGVIRTRVRTTSRRRRPRPPPPPGSARSRSGLTASPGAPTGAAQGSDRTGSKSGHLTRPGRAGGSRERCAGTTTPWRSARAMVGSREAPEQFLWRGRLWKVRDVLAHWVETGPWWQSSGVRAVVGDDAFAEEQPVATARPADRARDVAGRGRHRDRPTPGSSTCPSPGPTDAGSSSAARTEGSDDEPLPASRPPPTPTSSAPRSRCARRSPPPRSPTRYATAHVAALRAAAALLAARAAPATPPAPGPEERLGAARRGRSRADRVGRLLRFRCLQAGRRRGRLDPRGHRA